nr:FAD:protein FMN transferase [Sphingobium boeckii]
MGTTWSVRIAAPSGGISQPIGAGIQSALDRVVTQMSHWDQASDLCRFNRVRSDAWQSLPIEFFTVLEAALAVAHESEGAFDPALGALVDLWGFGPAGTRAAPPAPDAIAQARDGLGWRAIAIDRRGLRARHDGSATLDFSGIAKGFGVDQVADYLIGQGILHFLVEVGGELRGCGLKPDGQPWWVDLEAPPGITLPVNRVALHQLSVATSGDYRRHFEHEGARYAHSIDPRTGWPVNAGMASVTVLHPSCMMADAYATALTVLGLDQGCALAERLDIAAILVARGDKGAREWLSPAAMRMLD